MTAFQIERSESTWQLKGDATLFELSRAKTELRLDRPESGAWTIDCQSLAVIDTAGLAFLLECIRFAKQHELSFKIKNLPKAVKPLMEAQGVSGVFDVYLS